MTVRSHPLAASLLLFALVLAGCGQEDEKRAPEVGAAEASADDAPSAPASEANSLSAATREFANSGCAAARRKLELCAACNSAEQEPMRDLLLAYCREREVPSEARALYEAIITDHPGTEASVSAIMRVRQIDAAVLPPLGEYAGPKPTPVDRPQPAYPTLAETAGVEGSARVRFDVLEDGSVANVRVVESSPPLLFDAVALYAVSSWKYEPGRSAESQQITLRFDLADEPGAEASTAAGEPGR